MARARTFPLGLLPPMLVGKPRLGDPASTAGRRPVEQPVTRPLRNLVAPTVTGTPTIGQVLTSSTLGSWSGDLPISFARQWLRDGVPISGATSDSILLSVADFGANITCRITATNPLGSVAVESNALGPIAAVLPSNVVAPVVSGTPTEDETLSCTTGSWSGTTPITFSFQWRRDGSPIGGATTTTYVLQAADVGAMVDCVVTATNVGGSTNRDSNDVGPIAASGGVAPTITVAPVLAWTVAHGSSPTITEGTYTGDAGTWTYDLVRLPSTTVLAGVSKATVEAYVADRATDVGPDWKITGTITNGSGSDAADSNVVAWDPIARLPTLRLALDADLGVSLVGSDVDSWADQSGLAQDFSFAVSRPLFSASGFNGGAEPYVLFDGAAELMRRAGFSWGATLDTFSVLLVRKVESITSGDIFWQYPGSGASPYGQQLVGPNRDAFVARSGGTLSTPNDLTPQVAQYIYSGGTLATLRIGDTVVGPTAMSAVSHSDGLTLGLGGLAAGGAYAHMQVAAFYACRAALSTDQQLDFRAYCAWRWGV